jgi:DNA-binding FadR family transcriptional regulator
MSTEGPSGQRRQLVQTATEQLRAMIFAAEPDAMIGSLPDLAKALGVGVVTVQQAARILEHEGLLDVRRGPGGGYYGRRPDAAVLERSLAAYMRTQPHSWEEAVDMTSLLFNELVAAAAGCRDTALHAELSEFDRKVETATVPEDMATLELEFQDLLFRMVDRPLFELLTRVTLRFSSSRANPPIYTDAISIDRWKQGRHRIIAAILARDEELARFEANRNNRRVLEQWLRQRHAAG